MNSELAIRIKRAYPTGLVCDLDNAALISEEQDERVRAVLSKVAAECSLSYEIDLIDKPAYSVSLTQEEHPPFNVWIWQMRNPEKLAWIKANEQPYPVFWLKISRVANFYYYFYNHWVPRGDTGYLDADFERPPNSLWAGYERAIRHKLESEGFEYFTDELARERTDLVLEPDFDSIPDDDPRWDDDGFEPPLTPSSLHKCLFGDF